MQHIEGLSLVKDSKDQWVWKEDASLVFMVSSAYRTLINDLSMDRCLFSGHSQGEDFGRHSKKLEEK
ncbi:hypothetical protein VNO80_23116 [Phaseolus coccineus]|uniref:Uncharacterized protein n=1 Tax=Phaseolus coccineus TaxID=3886 RepID=A0AAN9QZF4_PHACN